jgi:hypothetical protein
MGKDNFTIRLKAQDKADLFEMANEVGETAGVLVRPLITAMLKEWRDSRKAA